MGAYKLEVLSPHGPAPRGLDELRSRKLEEERNAAYAKGFKDGVHVTKDAIEAERNVLLAALREEIADHRMTAEGARHAVMQSLGPLIDEILKTVAPRLAGEGLVAAVLDRIVTALEANRDAPVVVSVSPDNRARLEDALRESGLDVTLREDPDLTALAVTVAWGGGVDRIAVDDAITEMTRAVEAYLDNLKEYEGERTGTAG